MMTELLEDKGNGEEQSGPILLKQREELIYRAEPTCQNLHCPRLNRCTHQHGHTVNMKKWELIKHDVVCGHFMRFDHLIKIMQEV